MGACFTASVPSLASVTGDTLLTLLLSRQAMHQRVRRHALFPVSRYSLPHADVSIMHPRRDLREIATVVERLITSITLMEGEDTSRCGGPLQAMGFLGP